MPIRLLTILFCLLLVAGCGDKKGSTSVPETSTGNAVTIPQGPQVSPEGTIGAGEWSEADSLHIRIDSAHAVTVQYKHDDGNLAIRFTGVNSRGLQVESEVLLDTDDSKDSLWQADDLLLHVGYQDCEGRGRFDSLNCGMLQRGWFANNLPSPEPGIIELKISFSRLGLEGAGNTTIGLALAVQLPDGSRAMWPETAKMGSPATWGIAHLNIK